MASLGIGLYVWPVVSLLPLNSKSIPHLFFFFSCFMELELELVGISPLTAGAMLGFANRGQWRAASLWPR